MKHRFVAAALLAVVIVSGSAPFHAFAQNYRDGEMVTQDEYYRWLQSNNRNVRRRVNQLDDEPVKILPIPILFGISPSNLFPNFGDPRSGGRAHEGEDIMAPKGAPIVSPTEAVVLDTGVWAGGGNYVSTANPGGEKFVYMHLDWIADLDPGDTLDPGDLIGYVGNTGNASGGAPHLHFEIRKDGPTDPFPRLKSEFSLSQKMEFVEDIIDDHESRDEDEFIGFLLTNYRSQFLAAQALGMDMPEEIEKELQRSTAVGAGSATSLQGDLTLGSRGSEVIVLQNFLISQNKGPAARALAAAGATGNFGPITKNALAEYQKAAGISPADGYYGPLTRAYVQQTKPTAATAPAVPATPAALAVPIASLVPTRDLTLGTSGADVAWLQTFLIVSHSGSAAEALGRSGSTGYFGTVTQSALAEYQAKAGISPATGSYDLATRTYIVALLKPR